ncbi:MAG: hypothetical protein RRC34_15220 [Lentisphaeria bacterium]|nr:hypothetical protein [Lentisphaeria bacterium]
MKLFSLYQRLVYTAVGFACFATAVTAQTLCSGPGHDHSHGPAVDDRTDFPFMAGHVHGTVFNDRVFEAASSEDKITWSKLHLHAGAGFYLAPWFRIETRIKLEEAHNHGGCGEEDHDGEHEEEHDDHAGHDHGFGGDDRFFQDHYAVIEELKATVTWGDFDVFAGKFNPRSGLDMHAIPGLYGFEVLEEYSILERLGAGVRYAMETASFGTVTLELSSFFADTSFLNEGIGEDRSVPHSRADGGLANTESLASFSGCLAGDGWYAAVGDTIHSIDWTLGLAYQDGGEGHETCRDERRGSVGLVYGIAWTEKLSSRLVAEWLHAEHFAGGLSDNDFITVGVGFDYGGVTAGCSFTDVNRSHGEDGHYVQGSIGYQWTSGLGIHVVCKHDDREDRDMKSVGFALSYHHSAQSPVR